MPIAVVLFGKIKVSPCTGCKHASPRWRRLTVTVQGYRQVSDFDRYEATGVAIKARRHAPPSAIQTTGWTWTEQWREVASLLELPQTLEVYDQSPYRVCDITVACSISRLRRHHLLTSLCFCRVDVSVGIYAGCSVHQPKSSKTPSSTEWICLPRKPSPDAPTLCLKTGDVVNLDVMAGDFVVISFNRNYRCGKYVLY